MERMWSNRNERKEEKQRIKETRKQNRADRREAKNPALRFLLQEGYTECLQTLSVDEDCILLESERGEKIGPGIKYLAEILSKKDEFKKYKLYMTGNKDRLEEFQDYLSWIGIPEIQAVGYGTPDYYRVLATAKYLFNDSNFVPWFVKRAEQVYVKIWDVIPNGLGGRYAETNYSQIGNVQKNLISADYLLCPNEMTMNFLVDSYMLANIAKTKFMFTGSFMNEEVFRAEKQDEIRTKYHLDEKNVFLYLPKISGRIDGEQRAAEEEILKKTLSALEESLTEKQVLFVNLPGYPKGNIDLSGYKKIIAVPKKYTVYQMLSVADVLITDGSVAVFNFAVTRKKVILYDYKQKNSYEEYFRSFPDMPYPKAADVTALVAELNRGKEYDDTAFYEKYCGYSRPGMAESVCHKILLGEEVPELTVKETPYNGRKNVLIYPGTLSQNGITSAVMSLLNSLDTRKNNYILFYRMDLIKDREEVLKQLPENVAYYGYNHVRGIAKADRKQYINWAYMEKYPYSRAKKMVQHRIAYEVERLLTACRIDAVVQYDGYGVDQMMMFEKMPCKKIVYVHNNMVKELKKKSGIHKEILRSAYRNYDYVALVSEEQRSTTEKIAGYQGGKQRAGETNIVLAKNVINYQRVLALKDEPFFVDGLTEMNIYEDDLEQMLSSDKKKFITIGRFSAEKGHIRLLDAFEQLHKEHPDTCLIILGGYGDMYEKTVEKAKSLKATSDVAIIKYLSNPYALLKRCDYFVLSSFYEGLPVVITEADLVGLPCVSTDIPGPHAFMNRYGGLLVENSTEGVLDGMKKCLAGDVPKKLDIDYEQYNKEAVEQFERLI